MSEAVSRHRVEADAHLVLQGLTLAYGRAPAVHALDLTVRRGELVSLLGPSGCGKTTTMRAVAGLLPPAAGRIVLGGEDITRVPAHRRDIGLVFQSYALFPHLSAYENVAFGLRLRAVAAVELDRRVREALATVGLAGLEDRLPARLSGGQQQRVALARAVVLRPRLLLLDEPLSNLDARLRIEMRAELRRLQRELGITMLYVTHDQEEALALSDRIVVMREGRIEQDATPEQVFHRPATAFVATFMGWKNLLAWHDGVLQGDGGTWPLPLDRPVTHLAWRAEHLMLAPAGVRALDGQVLARSYLGERIEYLVRTAIGTLHAGGEAGAGWHEGDRVSLDLDPARAARIGPL